MTLSSFRPEGRLLDTRIMAPAPERACVGRQHLQVSCVTHKGVTCVTSQCDVRHTSSSGSGIGSGRRVHPPHRRASSTTRAFVGPSPRKSSRMKGSVFAWSSHTPRPQNRQTPRLCADSANNPSLAPLRLRSMLPSLIGRRFERATLERLAHDLDRTLHDPDGMPARASSRSRSQSGERPGARRSHQVVPAAEARDDRAVPDDIDATGSDREESIPDRPLRDQDLARRGRHPRSVIEQDGELLRAERREGRHLTGSAIV